MSWLNRHGHWLLRLFVAFVLVQSLFFKFTGSPETVYIFQGKFDPWAASVGFPGPFAPGGIFFHLFTPLGVAVVNTDGSSDGGDLFVLACVWVSCALLLWLRRDLWLEWLVRVRG